jgi:hypothetical protein
MCATSQGGSFPSRVRRAPAAATACPARTSCTAAVTAARCGAFSVAGCDSSHVRSDLRRGGRVPGHQPGQPLRHALRRGRDGRALRRRRRSRFAARVFSPNSRQAPLPPSARLQQSRSSSSRTTARAPRWLGSIFKSLSPRGRPTSVGDGARGEAHDASPLAFTRPRIARLHRGVRGRRDKRPTDLGERGRLPDAPSASARNSRAAPGRIRSPVRAAAFWCFARVAFSVAAGWACAVSHPSVE